MCPSPGLLTQAIPGLVRSLSHHQLGRHQTIGCTLMNAGWANGVTSISPLFNIVAGEEATFINGRNTYYHTLNRPLMFTHITHTYSSIHTHIHKNNLRMHKKWTNWRAGNADDGFFVRLFVPPEVVNILWVVTRSQARDALYPDNTVWMLLK